MCGIAGYKYTPPQPPEVLEAMVEALYHRGPDAAGFYRTEHYHAGMRRLSINGLTDGNQPLYNEDGSVVLFYNGEIYNYPDLRHALERRGHTFKTGSDGEVICHLYEEYGQELFEKLDGMFAAALWDNKEQQLILARDLPGEKPLYYIRLSDSELVFASEIKSLLRFPGWERRLNLQAMWDFPTFLWVPEPSTIYESVQALPRGHILTADARGIKLSRYKNLFERQETRKSSQDQVAEIREVISRAVRSRLLSDVPVGCFLSSGLDSSIVATLAAESLPELTTFTIGFENIEDPYHGQANEAEYAEQYAKRLGSTHHTIQVSSDDFHHNLNDLCIYGDQPFSVSSGLGILSIAKAARQEGIKVLLTGDGADECFGGYSWYEYLQAPSATEQKYNHTDKPVSFQNFGMDLPTRLKILEKMPPQNQAWAWHYYAAEQEKAVLFSRDMQADIQSSHRHFSAYRQNSQWRPEDFIGQDRDFYLPNEMLRKADRMTMAHSVEGRVPFVAPEVLALAARLRYSMVEDNTLKWGLRKAFAGILPPEVSNRPKHGFNVPIDHWLKGDWSDLLHDSLGRDSCLMKMGFIHKNSAEIATKMLHDPQRLNGHTIFSFIMLNMWLEKVHGNHC